ncbi:MAG: helix-turn-helix transcriptional regulator [Candidatus Bathyarchaeota archaeon]|nr:helix-turn-helix transcriptional regulator [Candidatus Bathyarchaeota archaeon]
MENTIKVLRAVKGVTQEQLAEDLGVTRQTIHAVESGKYNPSIDLAFKLARYFETSIEEIFQYEP